MEEHRSEDLGLLFQLELSTWYVFVNQLSVANV